MRVSMNPYISSISELPILFYMNDLDVRKHCYVRTAMCVIRLSQPLTDTSPHTLDADVRVVVSASLRRMVPTVLRDLGREEADLCLSAFLVHIPSLMGDHAPIPQYTLRLLCEAIKASPHAIHVVTTRSPSALTLLSSTLFQSFLSFALRFLLSLMP